MPYIEDRGGIDFHGDNPWKGYPVTIVERVLRICENWVVDKMLVGPATQFYHSKITHKPVVESGLLASFDFESIDDLDFIAQIEEEFGIKIPDHDAQRFLLTNVGEFVQYLKGHI